MKSHKNHKDSVVNSCFVSQRNHRFLHFCLENKMSRFPKMILLFVGLLLPIAIYASPVVEQTEPVKLTLEINVTDPLDADNSTAKGKEESPFTQVLNFTKGLFENVKKIAEYVAKVKDIVVKAFETVKELLKKEEENATTTTTTTAKILIEIYETTTLKAIALDKEEKKDHLTVPPASPKA
ncbi:unnamed protein product, partial [Mesorhabditis belari]|uniref:Uncharacterized protein n=1 Tax=Mesorhabditis belari TaxID=2138241 RepID=A0AAF3FG84_9BILA